MRNTKNKITLFLSCAMCICMTLCCSLPTKAAANDVICYHTVTETVRIDMGYEIDNKGHMKRWSTFEQCKNPSCNHYTLIATEYDTYYKHDWESQMIEDLHNGLYMHEIHCPTCGYSDTTLSDSPTNPKI